MAGYSMNRNEIEEKYRENLFFPPYIGSMAHYLHVGDMIRCYVSLSDSPKKTGSNTKIGKIIYIHPEKRFYVVEFETSHFSGDKGKQVVVKTRESYPMYNAINDVLEYAKEKNFRHEYEMNPVLPKATYMAVFSTPIEEDVNAEELKKIRDRTMIYDRVKAKAELKRAAHLFNIDLENTGSRNGGEVVECFDV